MSPVTVRRVVDRPIHEVWAAVADPAVHRLPLTTVQVPAAGLGVGARFVARTGVGPLRFADPMIVTRWSPPQRPGREPDAGPPSQVPAEAGYAVVKVGRVLTGWAQVQLQALDDRRTALVWTEHICVKPSAIGPLLQPLTDRAVAAMFGRAVDAMLSAQ